MKKNLTHKEIWSEKFWEEEADKIELAYWKIIKEYLPNVPASKEKRSPSEHRIEQYVREASRRFNIGNLHVGLTSSDLEDNIRIKRLILCNGLLEDKISEIRIKIANELLEKKLDRKGIEYPNQKGNIKLKAKTHLLDAGCTNLMDRLWPTLSVLTRNQWLPDIKYKGIGGSLGDLRVQKHINHNIEKELEYEMGRDKMMWEDMQPYRHQTGDHEAELKTAQWIQVNAMVFGKLCNDLRQMFAFGQAVHKSGDVASTAIVSKKTPNPWRYEKASAIFDELIFLPVHVARIGANCLLERTLTNQSALNRLFERAYEDMELALDLFLEAWKKTKFISDVPGDYEDMEIKLVDIIREKKIGREEAYKLLNDNIK